MSLDDLPAPLRDALDYWRGLAGSRFAPSWRNFDLLALPPGLIPLCTVVDRAEPLEKSVYRFWGSGHVEAKGIDRTGHSIGEHPQGRAEEVLAEYGEVIARSAPVAFVRDIDLPEPRPTLPQLSLRMPLSSDGDSIDKFVSICGWMRSDEAWRKVYGLG